MAPPNGAQTHASGPRKRMVQPVLPTLPLLNRTKRNVLKIEAEKVTLSDTATNGIRTAEISTNKHDSSISGNGVTAQDVEPIVDESGSSEEFTSTSTSGAYDTDTSHESLQTVQPLVENEIEQCKNAIPNQDTDAPSMTVQPEAELVKDNSTSTPQVDAITSYTNGHKEEELDVPVPDQSFQEPVTPVADTTLPNNTLQGRSRQTSSFTHSIASPTAYGIVSPIVEPSMKQHRRIETPSHAIPEAITNGHVSPMPTSILHHHTLSVPSPARTPHIPTIHEHLLHLANSKQWADWMVEIHQPGLHLQSFLAYAHSFVLLRSEKMRKIMARPQDPAFANNVISLYPARSVQPHAFEAALRFFYSDTVLSAEALFPRDTYMDKHARAHVIDYTLSYWTAGIELGLEPVTSRAFNLLVGMIDWDVAELLTKEVMAIRASVPLVPETEMPSESMIMADSILRQIFRLFTHNLDLAQFRLDTEAQAEVLVGRFAQLDYSRPTSNPALATMVFGSMPSSGNRSPSIPHDSNFTFSADTVASIILLNLDFADLCAFAREIIGFHGDIGLRIINEVVAERERRRLLIISNRGIPNKQRMANSGLWDNLGFKEYLDDGNIRRERVGYLLPHKRK